MEKKQKISEGSEVMTVLRRRGFIKFEMFKIIQFILQSINKCKYLKNGAG